MDCYSSCWWSTERAQTASHSRMFAALRGRAGSSDTSTRSKFGDRSDDETTSTQILDSSEQETIVQTLETQALRSARTWRTVFGGAAVVTGLVFMKLALSIATSDVSNQDVVWSQFVHLELYHHQPNAVTLLRLFWLDVMTAVALISSGVAMHVPDVPGRHLRRHAGRVTGMFLVAIVFGAASGTGWWFGLSEAARLEYIDSRPGSNDETRTFHFPWRQAWIPGLAFLGPCSCYYCDSALRETILETRELRKQMYAHKRA